MLGLVITLVASATPAASAAPLTCADGPLCEAPAPADEDRTYATPAVVDCPSPRVPFALSTLVGECDGTPQDAWFLVSRSPDGEPRPLAFRSARHERRGRVALCDGLPPKGDDLTLSDAQPLALYATAGVVPTAARVHEPREMLVLPSRFGDPPDRPPRG